MGAGSFVQEVCVVDDDRQVADFLDALLTNAGFTVRAFGSARDFLNSPSLSLCACLVVNLTLREMPALELQLTLQRYDAPCRIVFISDPESVRDSVRAMKLGAFNILARPIDVEQLIHTVRAALADHFSGQSRYQELSAFGRRWATLTSREQQVFKFVATGWSNKQVAAALCITDRTVKGHRRNAMEKMKARRITDAVRMWQDLSRHEQAGGRMSQSLFPRGSGLEGGTLESPYR